MRQIIFFYFKISYLTFLAITLFGFAGLWLGLRMVSYWCPTRTTSCVGLFVAARRGARPLQAAAGQYGELVFGAFNEASETTVLLARRGGSPQGQDFLLLIFLRLDSPGGCKCTLSCSF